MGILGIGGRRRQTEDRKLEASAEVGQGPEGALVL